MTLATTIQRHAYRCADCLSVVFHESANGLHGWDCLLCKGEDGAWGKLEPLGPVVRDRLRIGHEAPICDGRCTHATGPKCSCVCRGEHHGSGRTITWTTDGGPVIPTGLDRPAALARATEFRAARSAAQNFLRKYDTVRAAKRSGAYLSGSDFSFYCEGERATSAYWSALKLRTHASRVKALLALAGVDR